MEGESWRLRLSCCVYGLWGNSNNLASYEIRWAIRCRELSVIAQPDYHGPFSEYNNGPARTVTEPAVWEKHDPLLLSGEPSQFVTETFEHCCCAGKYNYMKNTTYRLFTIICVSEKPGGQNMQASWKNDLKCSKDQECCENHLKKNICEAADNINANLVPLCMQRAAKQTNTTHKSYYYH